jgi:hypothetical protein
VSDERDAIEQRMEDFADSDGTEHEPEEFDPASLGPDIPSIETGESAGASADADEMAADVDEELARGFFSAVLLANLGLFALALGALLAYFRGQYTLGGGAMLVGTVALVRTYWLVRKHGGSG